MKSKIIIKRTLSGQAFYLLHDKKEYYLFTQNYCKATDRFFKKGVYLNELNKYYKTKSSFVKRTLDKIKRYLTYIDKYHNIKLFNSNIKQNKKNTYSVRGINFKNNSGFTDVLYSA